MTACYRIVHARHADTPFDGEGARLFGGRWNSKGVAAVYFSDSAALAMLEVLVHLNDESELVNWRIFRIEIPDGEMLMLRDEDLPSDWLENPPSSSTQLIGDAWLESGESLALSVPSATLPYDGRNIIVNPNFSSASEFFAGSDVTELEIDPRLLP